MKTFQVKIWRMTLVIAILVFMALGIFSRLVYLNIIDRSFLRKESNARIIRVIKIPAFRGMITSRQNVPLAVSTPVDTIWANPQLFDPTPAQLSALAGDLNISVAFIRKRVPRPSKLEFVYLKRKVPPPVGKTVMALAIKGLHLQHVYKRYYPGAEVDAHVVGFTNISGQGQAGLELAYNRWLSGRPGLRKVIIDRFGHVIADLKTVRPAIQGRKLTLSIDQGIQFLAYRALKEVVEKYHAKAGSVVVLSPQTGEVLAMVNQPSYNPNARPPDTDGRYRNRAVTDMYEPGSVIKPFTVVHALESGKYTTQTLINTNPGWIKVGGYIIRDDGVDHGIIDLRTLLQKSSNVGAAKVMLSLNPHKSYELLSAVGFGHRTESGFPGESPGLLRDRQIWRPSVVASLAYGYGIAVTALQLAHAYGILADHGRSVPVTFLKLPKAPMGVQVIPANIADTVLNMLQSVVDPGGTGTLAHIPGYRVAGKTGTAYIAGPHGYNKHHYMASFVGVAPVSNPKLVVVVSIRDPQGRHFGGLVAAPVFAKVMGGALRLLNIPPDRISGLS